MSYPRHEYFRRVLCDLLGNEMESGLLPEDDSLVGRMIAAICYYFQISGEMKKARFGTR